MSGLASAAVIKSNRDCSRMYKVMIFQLCLHHLTAPVISVSLSLIFNFEMFSSELEIYGGYMRNKKVRSYSVGFKVH